MLSEKIELKLLGDGAISGDRAISVEGANWLKQPPPPQTLTVLLLLFFFYYNMFRLSSIIVGKT